MIKSQLYQKMIPPIKLLAIILLSFSGLCSADILTEGIKIDAAREAMKKAGYKISGLEWAVSDRSHSLEFWSVDEGTLVALYSMKTNEVISFSYNLSDERPKDLRKEFDFAVISFDTVTKRMIIQTKAIPEANPTEPKNDTAQ